MRLPGVGIRAQAVMDVEGEQRQAVRVGTSCAKCSSTMESRPPLQATAIGMGSILRAGVESLRESCRPARTAGRIYMPGSVLHLVDAHSSRGVVSLNLP
jgi:hypothetical protein